MGEERCTSLDRRLCQLETAFSALPTMPTMDRKMEEQLRTIAGEVNAATEKAMSTYVDAARFELSARIETIARQCSDAVQSTSMSQAAHSRDATTDDAGRGA